MQVHSQVLGILQEMLAWLNVKNSYIVEYICSDCGIHTILLLDLFIYLIKNFKNAFIYF